MKPLSELVRLGKRLRAVGFDDAPFEKRPGAPVSVSGIVCAGPRFEGMVWGQATVDGADATDTLAGMLLGSKFHPQVHLVLLDGVTLGGFNVVDLPALAERLERPCVAVMRRRPNLPAIAHAVSRLPDAERRLALIRKAGPIHEEGGFVFQVQGAPPGPIPAALAYLTDQGGVPEPLRLAHLIGLMWS